MHDRFAVLLLAGLVLSSPAAASDTRARAVVDPKELGERTQDFERSLTDLGLAGHLTCASMVEVVGDAGGQDQSFGGICTLQ